MVHLIFTDNHNHLAASNPWLVSCASPCCVAVGVRRSSCRSGGAGEIESRGGAARGQDQAYGPGFHLLDLLHERRRHCPRPVRPHVVFFVVRKSSTTAAVCCSHLPPTRCGCCCCGCCCYICCCCICCYCSCCCFLLLMTAAEITFPMARIVATCWRGELPTSRCLVQIIVFGQNG